MIARRAAALGILLLTGCSGPVSAPTPLAPTSTARSTDRAPQPSATSTPSAMAHPVAAPAPIGVCEPVPDDILRWIDVAISPHPGPRLGAVMVRAAQTETGTWHVVAVERGYAHDDGTRASGHDEVYALTNATRPVGSRRLISLDGPWAPWGDVSWTGAQRDVGRTAAVRAEKCLQQPRWRTQAGRTPDPTPR